MDHFLRSLLTKYVRYFNSHYVRIGPLFQAAYKAVHVENDEQFIYLSKYIHRNPLSLSPYKESPRRLKEYRYFSYCNYLHLFRQSWLKTDEILSNFSTKYPELTYESFVEQDDDESIKRIKRQAIDFA